MRPVRTALLLAFLVSCNGALPPRWTRDEMQARLDAQKANAGGDAGADNPGLLLGEFPLASEHAILDGDTIRVIGLRSSMRLLGIDTEETFKKEHERRDYADGWQSYIKKVKGKSTRPVKFATPLGEQAKVWAEQFFAGVRTVRLERDHPAEIRDFYGRYLAYVFIQRDGKWVNYNIEAVRAGMSPYFEKYGRSRRFHEEFVKAQAEARAKKIGIWEPGAEHYPDYPERLAWWGLRGTAVATFEEQFPDTRPDVVVLTRLGAMRKLAQRAGKEAIVFGSVGEIKSPKTPTAPTMVLLARTRVQSVPVVFFDRAIYEKTRLSSARGEFVAVKGEVELYKDKPQVVVKNASQVRAWVPGDLPDADEAQAMPEPPDPAEEIPAENDPKLEE